MSTSWQLDRSYTDADAIAIERIMTQDAEEESLQDVSKGKTKQVTSNQSYDYGRGESSKSQGTPRIDLSSALQTGGFLKTFVTSQPHHGLLDDGYVHMMLHVIYDNAVNLADVITRMRPKSSRTVTPREVMRIYAHVMFDGTGQSPDGDRICEDPEERQKVVEDFGQNLRLIEEAKRHRSHLKVVDRLFEPDTPRGRS